MRSILLIHKPHYRQRSRVCKAGTGITVDVSSEERTSDLPGRWKHVTCFVIGRKDTRLADWRWRQYSRSFVWCFAGKFTVHKPHYRQPGRVCKAGTGITVDVSSERTHFRPPWSVKARDLLRDWSEGHAIGWLDMTSEVAFFWAGRSADAFKAEKPGPVRSVDEIPGRSEVGSSSQPAVHSNQFPGHPLPLLPTHVPGPQGWDWEWKNSFYVEVSWRNLKNSPPASDEKILELGWCDWCFTAEKSVPVRSDEECTFIRGIPSIYSVQNYVDSVICICSTRRRFYGDCSWKVTEGTFKKTRIKIPCK